VWTVYRYYGAAGQLRYVGATGQGHWRSHDHGRAAEWWPLVNRGEFEHFTSAAEALDQQRRLIASLAPLYNRLDNAARWTPGRARRRTRRRRLEPGQWKPAGPLAVKRHQVEAYLAALSARQLDQLTAREIADTLRAQGLEVSEGYVAQILDEWNARRGSGARRKGRR
jgi:hypothetical protein